MEVIATYWWAWLLCAGLCGALAIANQVSRMKRIKRFDDIDSIENGVGTMALLGFASYGFLVMFVLSIIINFIDYARN